MSMSKSISPSPDPARKQDAIDPSIEVPDNIDAEAKRQTDVENPSSPDQPDAAAPANPWQAIFSVQHNAYYFYNSQTNETTWINPLEPDPSLSTEPAAAEGQSHASTSKSPQPESSSSTSQETSPQPSASASHYAAMQAAAIAAGIDPSLAYLDPSLAASTSTAAGPLPNTFTAKFNARTGAFTTGDARDPGHLSEYERAKRMSEFYFDVNAWEKDVEARKRAEKAEEESGTGGKRKRPSRKDLERFKEQKKQKKIAKTAWLRN